MTYILFHKPFAVLSQFSGGGTNQTLRDFGPFPAGVYPAGRLDADSEGLLLLTDDREILHRWTDPQFGHSKTYLVQVEGSMTDEAVDRIRAGILIGNRKTRPAEARIVPVAPSFPARPKPIRFRRNIPTCWIEITLREGMNRQIRRMTASVGHPTLRLIRTRIGFLTIDGLASGEFRPLTPREVRDLHLRPGKR
ncbi:MAG TPA: pseudouridine synthase [Bacteroidota bacterium]|nr:pseudouridine synthase [Bacteroidota bacterium]